MNRRIILTVSDEHETFHTYVQGEDLLGIAAILARLELDTSTLSAGFQAGTALAGIVGEILSRPERKVVFTQTKEKYRATADYRVQIEGRNIRVFHYSPAGETPTFCGDLAEFALWVKSDAHKAEGMIGKRVVFRYVGGSETSNRVVDIVAIEDNHGRGARYLRGKDVMKSQQEGQAVYRTFDERKIEGAILVIPGG